MAYKLTERTRRLRERVSDARLQRLEREVAAKARVVQVLKPLTPVKRARVLRAVAALYGILLPGTLPLKQDAA